MASPELADLAASFRRHLRAAGKADGTLRLYGQSTRFFCDWLTTQGRSTTLDQLTRHAIAAWLAELQDRNEASTVATRLRGMRRFCRWLVAEGELDKAPTEGLEIPTPTDKPPQVLTDDELTKLIKACAVPKGKAGVYDRTVFDGRRDEVIVRLLADCGIRVSELTNVDLDNVDLDQELVFVIGKGNRPRVVPFGAKTGQAIDRYLRVRSTHRHARSTRLLLSERGPMSADGVRWRVELLGQRVGIEGLHPHSFRHSFAHRWLAEGGQERDLMMLAGWKSDAMLAVYARSTAVARAQASHRRLALGDKL
jgi:site-specific recombinase XerD